MPKRTLFTNITPLPPQVTREVAVAMLHNHDEMIELNPLVVEHHPITTPRDAPADEFLDCVWQELTDKIHYLPGGLVKGKVSYKACFHDTPMGLQTHIYAPLGLDIREKWSIGGSLPGEPPEPRELGLDVPRQGLYIREDGDMRCNIMLSSFVRKNLDHAHKVLVERILKKAERVEEHRNTMSHYSHRQSITDQRSSSFQSGSHMASTQIFNQLNGPISPQMLSPQQDANHATLMNHPAFRNDAANRTSTYSLPPYQAQIQRTNYYSADMVKQQPQPQPQPQQQSKTFVAELPGSTYHTGHPVSPQSPQADNRQSIATELSGSEPLKHSPNAPTQSDRGSMISGPQGYRYSSNTQGQSEYGSQVSDQQRGFRHLSQDYGHNTQADFDQLGGHMHTSGDYRQQENTSRNSNRSCRASELSSDLQRRGSDVKATGLQAQRWA